MAFAICRKHTFCFFFFNKQGRDHWLFASVRAHPGKENIYNRRNGCRELVTGIVQELRASRGQRGSRAWLRWAVGVSWQRPEHRGLPEG